MLTSWQNTLHNAQCHVILGPLLLLCTTSLECTFEECRAVSLLSVLSLMLSEKEGDIILLYSEQRNDFSCQGELSIQLSFISNPIMHILTCCTICNILQILNAIKWYFTQCNIFLTEQWHFDIIFAVTLVWEVVLVDVRQFSNCKLCVIHYCQNSSEMSLLWCPRALSALQDLSPNLIIWPGIWSNLYLVLPTRAGHAHSYTAPYLVVHINKEGCQSCSAVPQVSIFISIATISMKVSSLLNTLLERVPNVTPMWDLLRS